jgi:hypothetical protein
LPGRSETQNCLQNDVYLEHPIEDLQQENPQKISNDPAGLESPTITAVLDNITTSEQIPPIFVHPEIELITNHKLARQKAEVSAFSRIFKFVIQKL